MSYTNAYSNKSGKSCAQHWQQQQQQQSSSTVTTTTIAAAATTTTIFNNRALAEEYACKGGKWTMWMEAIQANERCAKLSYLSTWFCKHLQLLGMAMETENNRISFWISGHMAISIREMNIDKVKGDWNAWRYYWLDVPLSLSWNGLQI